MKTKYYLSMTLLLIAFSLFTLNNVSLAQEQVEIIPGISFEYSILLQGQSTGSLSTTSAEPFDIHSVGVVSIGNQTLSANLTVESEHAGVWWISLLGLDGTAASSDFAFGLAPNPGENAQIFINPTVGLALAVGGVSAIDPVTDEDPLIYSITVSGK